MNERIQELMDQCEEEYSTQNYPCWDMEKFAELLIRECIDQIDDGNSDHAGGNREAIDRIKEHFGVQE